MDPEKRIRYLRKRKKSIKGNGKKDRRPHRKAAEKISKRLKISKAANKSICSEKSSTKKYQNILGKGIISQKARLPSLGVPFLKWRT